MALECMFGTDMTTVELKRVMSCKVYFEADLGLGTLGSHRDTVINEPRKAVHGGGGGKGGVKVLQKIN